MNANVVQECLTKKMFIICLITFFDFAREQIFSMKSQT